MSTHDATSTVPIGHCAYCGVQHGGGKCPLVSALEYDETGMVRRVEFFAAVAQTIAPQGPESDADYRKRLLANIGGTINANKVATGTGDVLDEVGSYYDLPRRK